MSLGCRISSEVRFWHSLKWVLLNGQPVDFSGAFTLMDDKLRVQLQTELAPCTTQVFMDAYGGGVTNWSGKGAGGSLSHDRYLLPRPSLSPDRHQHTVWLYLRFTLNYRDGEELIMVWQ